jgi:hypothetical protein
MSPCQGLRYVLDGADIGGDVFTRRAVAAGGGEDQLAFLVAKRAGEAVYLRLGGERDLLVPGQAEEPPNPADEIRHLLVGEGVFEAEHGQRVRDLREVRGGGGADLARRAVLAEQVWELPLQVGIAAHQRVIFRVGNLRRVVAMVETVVARELGGKPFQLGRGFGFGHILPPHASAWGGGPSEGWRRGKRRGCGG